MKSQGDKQKKVEEQECDCCGWDDMGYSHEPMCPLFKQPTKYVNSPKDYLTDREKLEDKIFGILIKYDLEDVYPGTGLIKISIEISTLLTKTIEQSMEVGREELIRKTEERLVGLCGTIHHESFPECEQCKGMEKLMKVIKSLSPNYER